MLRRITLIPVVLVAAILVAGALPAAAHPHSVSGNGQQIANGQNHPAFIDGASCESYGPAGSIPIGPAWYGLESAHHGHDSGDPGRADGCYETTGLVPPAQDDQNPAIQ